MLTDPEGQLRTSHRGSSRRAQGIGCGASSHPQRSAEGTRSRHPPPARHEAKGRRAGGSSTSRPPGGRAAPAQPLSSFLRPKNASWPPPLPGVPALCELCKGRKRDILEGKPRPLRPAPNPAVTSAWGPAAAAPLLPSGGGRRQRPRLPPARPRRSARPRPAPPPRPFSPSASPRRSS